MSMDQALPDHRLYVTYVRSFTDNAYPEVTATIVLEQRKPYTVDNMVKLTERLAKFEHTDPSKIHVVFMHELSS